MTAIRELTAAGWDQAQALATWLAPVGVTKLLSSPYTRCSQTLEPLGLATSLPVTTVGWLAEAMPFEIAIEKMAELEDGTVMCSHGDLIPDVISALIRRGVAALGEPRWEKGSAWVLHRDGRDLVSAEPVGTTYALRNTKK